MSTPALLIAPTRAVRSRIFDSARWADYEPRPDDIIIGTYSKCGTTWMQRIVSMLVFKSAEPRPIWDLSPWPDMRLFGPIEETWATANAQTHRRFFKTHLPLDALPLYDGVKVIHVARDGRDAAMSLHNHFIKFTEAGWQMLAEVSRADPKFGQPPPRTPEDPREFFADWVKDGGAQGDDGASFYNVENSYWQLRKQRNVLLVHYNDLKADRAGEMQRIAGFLDIEIPPADWASIVAAAGFEAMKAQGDALIPAAAMLWEQGSQSFLNKGTNGRWQDSVAASDLAHYAQQIQATCTPALARWLEHGRRVAGDPADS